MTHTIRRHNNLTFTSVTSHFCFLLHPFSKIPQKHKKCNPKRQFLRVNLKSIFLGKNSLKFLIKNYASSTCTNFKSAKIN
jgi:hypothetical protein